MFDPFSETSMLPIKGDIEYTAPKDWRMEQSRPRVSQDDEQYNQHAESVRKLGLTCREPL